MQRQLTLFELPQTRFVSVAIRKAGKKVWKVVKPSNHPKAMKIQLSTSLFNSDKAYVFSLALNEKYRQHDFELEAKFPNKEMARQFMKHGQVTCRTDPCSHHTECQKRKKPIANRSPYWQYTYFLLYQKKIEFLTYTLRDGRRCCKIR